MSIGQVRYGPLDLTDYPYIFDPQPNLGAPEAESATVSRLLEDGDVAGGVRSGNRTLQLPVSIGANSRAEFAAAEVALFAEVNRALNTLTVLFGAGDGLPVVADTYRGQITPTYDADLDFDYVRSYVITCPAEPFFRSPDPITISPSSAATQIDAFENTTGLTTSSTATADTTTFVRGSASVKQQLGVTTTFDGYGAIFSATWARSIASTDLSLDVTARLWLLTDVVYSIFPDETHFPTLTLFSAGGKSSTWHSRDRLVSGWTAINWDLTDTPDAQVAGGVNLAAVTGWAVDFEAAAVAFAGFSGTYHVWADDLRAYPAGAAEITAGSANLFFADIEGAARTPVSLEVDTNGSGGVLLANTPNPPPGYDPVLLAVTNTPPSPIVVTRKAVTLRRPAPECSTYIVMVYGDIAGGVWTATASGYLGVTNSVSRVVTTSDPEYRNRNTANKALFAIGELTLPTIDVDPQNTAAAITITISAGSTINGAWLVWAGGENVMAFSKDDQPSKWFLDAVTPGRQAGKLLAGSNGRSDAYDASASRWGQAAINLDAGANHMLAVALPKLSAPTTNPTLTVSLSYFSRWLSERTS